TTNITGALNTTLTGTIPGPIPAGGTVNFTFPTTIDMTTLGTYNIQSFTTEPSDFNQANDTSATSITVNQVTINTFPYFEDFNSGSAYWIPGGSNPPLNGGRNFVLGNLPYLNGPQGVGDSWYVETTTTIDGSYIWVESPVFDFSGLQNPQMFFDIKHSLYSSDYFRVTYSIDGGTTWLTLGSGPSATWYNNTNRWTNSYTQPVDQWKQMQYDLCNLIGESCVKFRFYGRPYYGEPGYTGWHYFAFDNFHITDTPLDAKINTVVGCYGSQYQIDVTVTNEALPCTSTPVLTDFDLTYTINGSAPTTINYNGQNILGGSSSTVSITGATVPTNTSTISVWITYPNGFVDQVFENDTIITTAINWPNCNDHCSNAIELGLGTTTATQNSNATIDPTEDPNFSSCGLITVENTVWYQFTTNATGDSVTVIFDQQICSPSQNGIQVSIDSVGTPCDMTTYTNMFCEAQNDTSAFQWGPLPLPPNTTYYIAVDGFAGSDCDFDITIVGAVNVVLPVNLISFTSNCTSKEGEVELKWLTASETNSDYYLIERSRDGVSFNSIAKISSIGNSSNLNSYYFKDVNSPDGIVYYRLVQIDLNGNTTYYNVVASECKSSMQISIYPNPAQYTFTVEGRLDFNTTSYTIKIHNALGEVIFNKNYVATDKYFNQTINSSELKNGVYYVSIYVNDKITTKKLVINK
ncbi:MAG TPA: T9SS type A sorting domain-containing protein, partial [Crocinitomix sp.]|nr:T9SS type A sorting domain-containing protein [Crocinitomix sp.]